MADAEVDDTIVALASGTGAAGVAVVRISGRLALPIRSAAFSPTAKAPLEVGELRHGIFVDCDGEPIDDCMVVYMAAPRTFTGEDVVEIQCHGSPAVVRKIIERCLQSGARAAQPGEFSRRAFLNGKMDLAQAEALSDLIASRSEAARKLSLRQLRGGLSLRLRNLYSGLIDAAAQIEAHLDFPEEDIPELTQNTIVAQFVSAKVEMKRLLDGHEKARVQVDGARVILAGEPNAGKSSLFNALVGRERAIVSPHPGTTRDTIEATLEINGLAITVVDTAGIRTDAGEIEQIGIDRTLEEVREADLVLHLADSVDQFRPSANLPGADSTRVLRVLTKQDQPMDNTLDSIADVRVSSQTGAGLSHLEGLISQRLAGGNTDDGESEMSRVRHAECVRVALESLDRASTSFQMGESGDLVMVDLRESLSALGEILGERLDEQILDRIFSTFCLGK